MSEDPAPNPNERLATSTVMVVVGGVFIGVGFLASFWAISAWSFLPGLELFFFGDVMSFVVGVVLLLAIGSILGGALLVIANARKADNRDR